MEIHATGDVEEYAAAAGAFLEAEPCARNVLRWVIEVVRADPDQYTSPPSFWWITDRHAVVGAASMTPPWPLLVSSLPDGVAPELARAVERRVEKLGIAVPGVNGPAASARATAAAWETVTGADAYEGHTMLLHEVAATVPVPRPRGERRAALSDDAPLLSAWLEAFTADAGVQAPPDPRRLVNHMIELSQIDLWTLGEEPVSMAGHREPVAGVVRVGPVYTPPEHRNHGYARRLTAEVTDAALTRDDVTRCMLFTDAANPVSNSIYRQAGYVPGDEHVEIAFGPRAHAGGG